MHGYDDVIYCLLYLKYFLILFLKPFSFIVMGNSTDVIGVDVQI